MKEFASKFLKSKITRAGGLLALVAAAAATVAWSNQCREPVRLEGAWIAKVTGMPLQWSYVESPMDLLARRASLSGSIQVHIPPSIVIPGLFADLEYNSPLVGEAVMTGYDTVKFTAVWYGMKKGFPFNQIVYIGVNSGEGTITAPGKAAMTHHLAFYYPSADADGDGLPDPGQAPALCLPPTGTIDTRVAILPPCTP